MIRLYKHPHIFRLIRRHYFARGSVSLAIAFALAVAISISARIHAPLEATLIGDSARGECAVADGTAETRATKALGRLPLSFEANQGRFDQTVKFAARGPGYQIALTMDGTLLRLQKTAALHPQPVLVRMKLAGANPAPKVTGREELPGKVNYYAGNDRKQWREGVATYAKIEYQEVYPGVDMIFYGNQRQLEYDLIVAPDADPGVIRLAFDGVGRLSVDEQGELVLPTLNGELRQRKPVVYQEGAAGRKEISGRFVLTGEREVGFEIGQYDRSRPLVIDPILVYSTYLGGSFSEIPRGIAVDATGIYVAGYTESFDFPGGPFISNNRGVYKTNDGGVNWNASGNGLTSAGIIALAIDPFNSAVIYAGGDTVYKSTDSGNTWTPSGVGLPSGGTVTSIAVNPNSPATVYACVPSAPSNSAGGPGIYQSNDGGLNWAPINNGLPAFPPVRQVAINPIQPSTIYVALTSSAGVYKSFGGGDSWIPANSGLPTNAVIRALAINPHDPSIIYAGTSLGVYRSNIGGASWSIANTGIPSSSSILSLGVSPVDPDTIYAGLNDGGVYKTLNGGLSWNPSSAGLPTLGVGFPSFAFATSTIYVAARSSFGAGTVGGGVYKSFNDGASWNPVNNGVLSNAVSALAISQFTPSTVYAGAQFSDIIFATKLNPAGDGILYTTYLGASGFDGTVLAGDAGLDSNGNLYLIGQTSGSNFPTTPGAFQTVKPGVISNFVCKLSSAGGLAYSTYLDGADSGSGAIGVGAVTADAMGRIFVTSQTTANNFPTTPGAFQTVKGDTGCFSCSDAVFAKLNPAGNGAADLLYATYLGGNANERGNDLAVSANGVVSIVGNTNSTNFPTTPGAFQPANAGGICSSVNCNDAFALKLNPAGAGAADLIYSTYLGGANADDFGAGVSIDAAGNIYAAGSASAGFPTTAGAYQTMYGGGSGAGDAFLVKLNPNLQGGASLVYSTFLGGSGPDSARRIVTDETSRVYAVGNTSSTNFPLRNPLQAALSGSSDLFVAVLNAAGSDLIFSTYLGGSDTESIASVALKGVNDILVCGSTTSTNFPLVNPFQSNQGGSDAFIAEIVLPCPTVTIGPAALPNGAAGVAYSQSLTATSAVGAVTWGVSSGAAPNGLTLNAATGVLSGVPANAGHFSFTIKATDANGCSGERNYALVINGPAQIEVIPPAPTTNDNISIRIFGDWSDSCIPQNPQVSLAGNQIMIATSNPSQTCLQIITPWSHTLAIGSLAAGSYQVTVSHSRPSGTTIIGAGSFVVTQANSGLQYYPLPFPVRLLDTRPGELACYTPGQPIPGGASLTQPARGVCNGLAIPANAAAITGNITTVQSGGGFLTLYPSDAARPLVANSNYNPNEIINNVFTVGLGAADGAFNIFVLTTTDVVIDVTGYYAPPGAGGLYFHPLPRPVRLLETRVGEPGCYTPGAPLPGNFDSTQQATGVCAGLTIPSAARAIVGNATTVNPGGGFLTLYPADAARPLVASSNYNAGQIMNAPFTVGLSPTGAFKIYPLTQTDLVIDVLGYYSPEATDVNGAGLLFYPLAHPVRLLETRNDPNALGCYKTNAPIQGGVAQTQPARGVCDGVTIASDALGIVGNATVVNANGGFLTFWPSDAPRPLVATSNFTAGQIFNRHFTVGLSAGPGAFNIFALLTTDLVIDVSGYFAP
jgi:hypothetical protein